MKNEQAKARNENVHQLQVVFDEIENGPILHIRTHSTTSAGYRPPKAASAAENFLNDRRQSLPAPQRKSGSLLDRLRRGGKKPRAAQVQPERRGSLISESDESNASMSRTSSTDNEAHFQPQRIVVRY
ncbi:hypothetical protein M3Y99_01936100 [Aphelenchoides fujianensis]|nr:hypothetical protein M3Y99_01936100 [Aphelenchoides fujianensis]